MVVVDINEAAGAQTAELIRKRGGEARFVKADVAKADDVKAMIASAERRYEALHVLFNNAGVFPDADGSVLETEETVWDLVMNINLKGVFLGCKYGIPALIRAGGGAVINTASFVALMGAATSQIAYTASKGGVLAMTREIAVEFARRNIRCNALCPGPVETPLVANLFSDPLKRQRRMVHIPMGRLARTTDIAGAALFLASDESAYVNGATFTVDGGITAAYVTPEGETPSG